MTPTLSIIHCTYRPGGLRILVDSLNSQTDKDFSLYIVDDCPGRWNLTYDYVTSRMAHLTPLFRFCGPSKPKPHPEWKCGLANARNTVLDKIQTTHVLFVDDYLWLPPDAIARWKEAIARYDAQMIITGVGRVYEASRDPDNIFDGKMDAIHAWKDPQPKFKWKWDWVPGEYEGYNAMPIEFFWQTNGMDERVDHCTCFVPMSIVAQAKILGYKMIVDKSLVCRMVDHRIWHAGPNDQDGPWRINAWSSIEGEPEWVVPSVRSNV